jgi:oligopeptide transport system ATP-binding protein
MDGFHSIFELERWSMDPVLTLDDWSVSFDTDLGVIEAVRKVSLTLERGEVLAIVGESGCGKSVLCQSIMKILPRTARTSGRLIANGEDISHYPEAKMRKLRGPFFAMLFQDPMTTLNPTMPIGEQITEAILKHHKLSRKEAKERAAKMLDLVGIDNPLQRLALQPHFFSGGMRQRCVLAIAMALEPKVLLADEPTTALDVTVQARMLDILRDVKKQRQLSIIFISHDLGVVARIADRVAVMYAGRIVEIGKAEEIFYEPSHPYTWGLLSSMPSVAVETGVLTGIPGLPPTLLNPPPGDAFAYRNKYALQIDYEEQPPMFQVSDTHFAATWLLDPRAPSVEPLIKLKRRLN